MEVFKMKGELILIVDLILTTHIHFVNQMSLVMITKNLISWSEAELDLKSILKLKTVLLL